MFAIHGNLLPGCSTYAGAVKVWEEAHQHSCMPQGWRGLKDKRDTSKLVTKTADGEVRFRYHHTDLVEWRPDRLIVRTYDSQSSVIFTNCFLPPGMLARSIGGEMYIMHKGLAYQAADRHLLFKYDGQWSVDEDTVARFTTEVVDKKKAYRVRKVVQPFVDWRESMQRLGVPISHPRRVSTYDAMISLKTSIERGVVPEEHYRQLAASINLAPGTDLMCEAYVLGGAVVKQTAELGTPRKRTKYAASPAWAYL